MNAGGRYAEKLYLTAKVKVSMTGLLAMWIMSKICLFKDLLFGGVKSGVTALLAEMIDRFGSVMPTLKDLAPLALQGCSTRIILWIDNVFSSLNCIMRMNSLFNFPWICSRMSCAHRKMGSLSLMASKTLPTMSTMKSTQATQIAANITRLRDMGQNGVGCCMKIWRL